MNYCQRCGAQDWEYLKRGSCGGQGALKGCKKCRAVYRQNSGGAIPTPGGESWSRVRYTLDEYHEMQKKLKEDAPCS